MKLWMKALIGTVLFGGGFASGYFCHKKLNDVKFEEVTPEEMDILEKSVAERKVEAPANEVKTAGPEQIAEKVSDLPENIDELRNAFQGKTPYIRADEEQKKAYEKIWKTTKEYSDEENANQLPTYPEEEAAEEESPGTGEEEFDEEFLEQLEEETVEPGSAFVEPPHLISLSDFYNERPEFDKITINWYQPDNVWLDENDDIIADPESYVGELVAKLFNENPTYEDPDIRFVRNEKYGTDYEIIRHHQSYQEAVGGVN